MNTLMFAHFDITEFWTFLLGMIFIVLLSEPNSMYALSMTARRDVRAGYRDACGVFLGDATLMVLSAADVASLLKTSPVLFYVMKYIGTAYLAWIGPQMLRGTVRNWCARKTGESVAQDMAPVDELHSFKKVLIISLLSPKAILFFISFFIQFVDPHYALPVVSFAMLGLACQIYSFLYLIATILVGVRLTVAFRARRRSSAGMSSDVGTMFIGSSAKLATATLN